MLPSASAASAFTVTLARAAKVVLFAGVVILTVGALLHAFTVTATVAEIVSAPLLSVAFAVSEYLHAAKFEIV